MSDLIPGRFERQPKLSVIMIMFDCFAAIVIFILIMICSGILEIL